MMESKPPIATPVTKPTSKASHRLPKKTLAMKEVKAAMSMVPSMPMLTTPERSHSRPHKAPRMRGMAWRRAAPATAVVTRSSHW